MCIRDRVLLDPASECAVPEVEPGVQCVRLVETRFVPGTVFVWLAAQVRGDAVHPGPEVESGCRVDTLPKADQSFYDEAGSVLVNHPAGIWKARRANPPPGASSTSRPAS